VVLEARKSAVKYRELYEKKEEKNKRMVEEYDRFVLTREARRSIRGLKIRKAYRAMILLIVVFMMILSGVANEYRRIWIKRERRI
jgi:hypothetical protein